MNQLVSSESEFDLTRDNVVAALAGDYLFGANTDQHHIAMFRDGFHFFPSVADDTIVDSESFKDFYIESVVNSIADLPGGSLNPRS